MGRRRILLIIITLLIVTGAVLVALPLILAPLASQRLTAAVGAPVHVGRVTLSAFGPRVSAHGITLRLAENETPVARLGGIHADLALKRLLRGELALDSLTLVQPHLTVRRTSSGDIDLAALLPSEAEEPPAPTTEAEVPDQTPVDIGILRVRDGSVEFHDETTTPPIATIARIDRADADDLHLTLGGQAQITLRMTSRIEDDTFDLELTYDAAGEDSNLAASLRTTGASLARVLVHARLAWEHVAGTIDAEVTYQRTVKDGTLTAHHVSLDATGTDLALADSAAEEATFRAGSATLTDLAVDLAAQHVVLGTIAAEDFWALAYQDEVGLHLPFVNPAPADEPPSSWTTALDTVTLGTGTLLLRNLPPGSADLPIAVRSGRIATEDDAVRFVFDTAVGEGTIGIDGHARSEATTVKLAIEALDLPKAASHFGMPIAFASGIVGGTLNGTFQEGVPAHFRGRVVTTDVKSTPSEAHPEEVFAWATLEVDLADSTFAPPKIHATNATLTWPYLMLHRRPDGVYPFTGVTTTPATADAPPPAASGGPLFVLDRATIAHGRIEFYDTVFDDAYGADILDLGGTIETLRVAPMTVGRFDLTGSIDELSPIEAGGKISATSTDVTVGVDRLRLAPLSRYIEPGINYEVTEGTASIDTEVDGGETTLTVENDIDLARLKLRAHGTDPFKGELGVALPIALSLMKDSRGHIALDLPVKINLNTQEYELGPSIIAAIQQALLGTLLSPVRILGSVLLGDDGEVFDLKPVPFAAGSLILSGEGSERVAQLARLLERHPGLNLVLLPETTSADAEALANAEDTASATTDPKALAAQRAEVIQRTLHEAYAIDPKRVEARRPRADGRDGAVPSVDIQLRSD